MGIHDRTFAVRRPKAMRYSRHDAEAVEDRGDVEEDVVIDEEAEHHRTRPMASQKLLPEDAEGCGSLEIRGAVDEQAAADGGLCHERRAEEVEVEFEKRADIVPGHPGSSVAQVRVRAGRRGGRFLPPTPTALALPLYRF